MKPLLFCILSILISSNSHSRDLYSIFPSGTVSAKRMWNWILLDERTLKAKEQPALGVAQCHFNKEKLSELVSKDSNSLNNTLGDIEKRLVTVMGSKELYIPSSSLNAQAAEDVMALELAQNCFELLLEELPSLSKRFENLHHEDFHLVELKAVETNVLAKIEFNKNVNLKNAIRVDGTSHVLSLGYEFNKLDVHFSNEDRQKFYQSLVAAKACQKGQRWKEEDGELIILTNECDRLVSKIENVIEKREGGVRSLITEISGAAGCGVGRALEGSGNALAGTTICALSTELLTGLQCEGSKTIIKRVMANQLAGLAGGAIGNGSSLGDAAYKDPELRHLNKTFVTGVVSEGGRDLLYGIASASSYRSRQAIKSGLISSSIYHASYLEDSQNKILGIRGNLLAELGSGATRGYFQAKFRNDQCVDKLYQSLGKILNNETRKVNLD